MVAGHRQEITAETPTSADGCRRRGPYNYGDISDRYERGDRDVIDPTRNDSN